VYQRRIEGDACAAVFVGNELEATLLGITKQLIQMPWLKASAFQYAGSIAPFELMDRAQNEIQRIGNTLAERFSLIGLFGVDFILQGDQIWTLEVNPRYTASVEVVERASGMNAIEAHAAACCGSPIQGVRPSAVQNPQSAMVRLVHGKAILFADRPIAVREAFFSWAMSETRSQPWPSMADISPVGTTIASGQPVATVFAAGSDGAEIEHRLQERVREVERRLYDK
jgi:predicted ATP-grasp superfamily ATP-dependent carboligase